MRWSGLLACTHAAAGCIAVLAGCASSAAPDALVAPPAPCEPALGQQLQALVDDPALPLASLSVLALRDGEVVYRAAFGRRFIHPADPSLDRPATPDTLYRIASVSKTITALGALRLVEQGRLSLDGDIGDVLGYPVRNPRHPQHAITLRMLLSHTSTLGDEAGYFFEADVGLRDVLVPSGAQWQQGAAWQKQGEPGHWFQYANLNYNLLGALMERASGERFDHLMHRLVLRPLGLAGGYDPSSLSKVDWGRTATLYRKRDASERWQPQGPWQPQRDDAQAGQPTAAQSLLRYLPGHNPSPFSPTGGLRISADGLGTVVRMLLNQGRHGGEVFLQPATLELRHQVHWRWNPGQPNGDTLDGLFRAWGLGVQVFTDHAGPPGADRLVDGGGLAGFGHFGNAYGAYTGLIYDPARRMGLVYLVGGVGSDPQTQPGQWSAQHRFEERIVNALYRCALLSAAP